MKYTPPIGGAANDPYVDANPATGVEGSPVPAAAIEHPQREIEAVISGAGLTPAIGDLTQLRQAIQKMITGSPVIIKPAVFAAAVVTGNAVYWDAANSRFDQALADGTAKQGAVGFADVANGAVYAFGTAALFTGLTPGPYYLSGASAGAITATAPANPLFVGIAKSATEMFVDIDVGVGLTQAQADARYAALAGLATQTFSVAAATSDSHAVNLRQLNAPGDAPIFQCRAWVNFNGTGTVAIRASGNVSSITDNGVGDYTVNFTTAMPDADYAVSVTVRGDASSVGIGAVKNGATPLVGSVNVSSTSGPSGSLTYNDTAFVNVAIFR